jgi:hypothetical protein
MHLCQRDRQENGSKKISQTNLSNACPISAASFRFRCFVKLKSAAFHPFLFELLFFHLFVYLFSPRQQQFLVGGMLYVIKCYKYYCIHADEFQNANKREREIIKIAKKTSTNASASASANKSEQARSKQKGKRTRKRKRKGNIKKQAQAQAKSKRQAQAQAPISHIK